MYIWTRTRQSPQNSPTASDLSTTITCPTPHLRSQRRPRSDTFLCALSFPSVYSVLKSNIPTPHLKTSLYLYCMYILW